MCCSTSLPMSRPPKKEVFGGEFAKYAVIMDSTIDTAEDLAILTKAGVIVNHLGSDQKLVNMWNNMSESVTITCILLANTHPFKLSSCINFWICIVWLLLGTLS